jgi:ribosomal protein S18 acetylase RimI-like enzyme
MSDITIRKFTHTDVDDFIRISKISFAEETRAAGITPEDFELETRRIFRLNMIPYRILTTLMGIEWEGFVAEKAGKVVGGGMYVGRNNRMTITNLMVDPAYRRQGVGQALLMKRLERLSERGFPYVTAQVLETNSASLANLKKQDFEVFNRYSVYEHSLPMPENRDSTISTVTLRNISRTDRTLFREIERGTTPAFILYVNGGMENRYFLSGWQKIFARYTSYKKWMKAFIDNGKTIGFLGADFQLHQCKGSLVQPVVSDENLQYLPVMIKHAGVWLEGFGKESMLVEIPEERYQISEYLFKNGWTKNYTWLELIKWLDERARHEIERT